MNRHCARALALASLLASGVARAAPAPLGVLVATSTEYAVDEPGPPGPAVPFGEFLILRVTADGVEELHRGAFMLTLAWLDPDTLVAETPEHDLLFFVDGKPDPARTIRASSIKGLPDDPELWIGPNGSLWFFACIESVGDDAGCTRDWWRRLDRPARATTRAPVGVVLASQGWRIDGHYRAPSRATRPSGVVLSATRRSTQVEMTCPGGKATTIDLDGCVARGVRWFDDTVFELDTLCDGDGEGGGYHATKYVSDCGVALEELVWAGSHVWASSRRCSQEETECEFEWTVHEGSRTLATLSVGTLTVAPIARTPKPTGGDALLGACADGAPLTRALGVAPNEILAHDCIPVADGFVAAVLYNDRLRVAWFAADGTLRWKGRVHDAVLARAGWPLSVSEVGGEVQVMISDAISERPMSPFVFRRSRSGRALERVVR